MAARPSSPHEDRSVADCAQRVLSVSPGRMQPNQQAGMPVDTTTPIASEFDLPETSASEIPVPDIAAPAEEALAEDDAAAPSLDRFAAELSAMIEVAATTADSLNRLLRETGEGENRAAAASAQLQEQLRLGARMLKAFQSQISRVENTFELQKAYQQQVADTQAKIEQCFAGIEACVDKTLESVAYRLAELARTAVARFDEGIASRQQRLSDLDGRIAQCASGIDGICEMIESVQSSASAAVSSNQETLNKLTAVGKDAKRLLNQHEQARKSLASDLQAIRDAMAEMERHSEGSHAALREATAHGVRADASLRQRLQEIDAAQGDSERVAQTVVALNELLARLAPWEKLLLSGTLNADGLPEPLAKVASDVRQQISQDMNWLSLTMRDVAERVSQLAQVPAVAAPEPARGQEPDENEEPRQPEIHVGVKKPLRLRTFNTGA